MKRPSCRPRESNPESRRRRFLRPVCIPVPSGRQGAGSNRRPATARALHVTDAISSPPRIRTGSFRLLRPAPLPVGLEDRVTLRDLTRLGSVCAGRESNPHSQTTAGLQPVGLASVQAYTYAGPSGLGPWAVRLAKSAPKESNLASLVRSQISTSSRAGADMRSQGPQLFPSWEDSTAAGPDAHCQERGVSPRVEHQGIEPCSSACKAGGISRTPPVPHGRSVGNRTRISGL